MKKVRVNGLLNMEHTNAHIFHIFGNIDDSKQRFLNFGKYVFALSTFLHHENKCSINLHNFYCSQIFHPLYRFNTVKLGLCENVEYLQCTINKIFGDVRYSVTQNVLPSIAFR